MKIKVIVNKQAIAQFKSKINEAFGDVVAALDAELEAVIEDPYGFTDLGLVDHDIVDTGRLRDSQVVTVTSQGHTTTAEWEWDPVDPETRRHYAGDVFTGFVTFSGNWMPGRDWPGRAVERLDPLSFFIDSLKEKKI